MIRIGANVFTAKSSSRVSSFSVATGPNATMPAAITIPSSRPLALIASATSASTSAGFVRFAVTTVPGIRSASIAVE